MEQNRAAGDTQDLILLFWSDSPVEDYPPQPKLPWELYLDLSRSPNKLSTQLIGWASCHWRIQRSEMRPGLGKVQVFMGSFGTTGEAEPILGAGGRSYDGVSPFSAQQPSAQNAISTSFVCLPNMALMILAERVCITGFL